MKKNKKRNIFQKIFDLKYILFDFMKFTGIIPTLIYFRLKCYYVNKKRPKKLFNGPFIIISNHTSYLDPVILLNTVWNRRVSFVATQELYASKFGNFFFNAIRCIKINKENVSMQTFKEVKNVIERGHIVGLFPEGHIETGENIDSFKSGAVMFAVLCKVPIIQVYIHERSSFWQRQKVVISNKIDISELIKTKIPSMEEISEVTKFLEKQENELKEIILSKYNK